MAISGTVHAGESPDVAAQGATGGVADADDWVDERTLGFVPDRRRRYTADEVRALNAANPRRWPRYECVHGELLVTPGPAPDHYCAATELWARLNAYLGQALPGARAVLSPADMSWGGLLDTYVQPDAFVLAADVWRAVRGSNAWVDATQMLLAVEVVSSGSVKHDRVTKRDLYLEMGVPLYWIVDPRARHVEVWVPGVAEAVIERVSVRWQPEGAGEPFVLDVPGLFAEA